MNPTDLNDAILSTVQPGEDEKILASIEDVHECLHKEERFHLDQLLDLFTQREGEKKKRLPMTRRC